MALLQRTLNFQFQLGEGAFGESGTNTVKVSGLRASAKIVKAGGLSMGGASLQIYGLSLSLINQLSTLGAVPTLIRKNTVIVEAGPPESGTGAAATVFVGTIQNAYGMFDNAPAVPFAVDAFVGLFDAVNKTDPTSFTGAVNVASAMQNFATKMNLTFDNAGVTKTLPKSYYSGSLRDQAYRMAKDANIEIIIDNGQLAIWNPGQSRGGQAVRLARDSGMIGYPSYTSVGIRVQSIFNPNVAYGAKIRIESDLPPANKEWIVHRLEYDLDANIPGGKWMMSIEASPPGYIVVR